MGHGCTRRPPAFNLARASSSRRCSLLQDVLCCPPPCPPAYPPRCLPACRALAAQCLFTDIHLGNASGGAYAGGGFYSGGPPASGPNTGAWTVFWNIRSNSGVLPLPQHNKGRPGACTFGPDLTFVGVNFDAVQLARYGLCQDWYYQPGEISPPNLFWSQLQLRRHLLAKLKVEGERGAWTVTQPLHITIVDDPPAPSAAPSQQQDQQQQQQQQQQRAPGAPQAQLLGGGLEATATA